MPDRSEETLLLTLFLLQMRRTLADLQAAVQALRQLEEAGALSEDLSRVYGQLTQELARLEQSLSRLEQVVESSLSQPPVPISPGSGSALRNDG